MKKVLTYLLILLAIVLGLLKLFFDPIAKSLIEKNLTRDTGRAVSLQGVATNFFNGSVNINGLQIKNDKIFPRENLITIPLLEGKLKMLDLFLGKIHFSSISIQNPIVNYDLIIQNGKIIDSFYLVQGLFEKNSNKQSSNLSAKTQPTNLSQKNKSTSGPQIDFIIDSLNIPKITISVLSKDLQFSKNIILDKMIFENVGNTKNANHYKDVMAMIVTNMAVKLNNEVITGNLKNKFEKKLKNLLASDKLKSIFGSESEEVIKKFEKLFK